MKFSSSSGRSRRSRESGVFSSRKREVDVDHEVREESKTGRVRWAVVTWFYKWIGLGKGKGRKARKQDARIIGGMPKYSMDRGADRDSMNSKRNCLSRRGRSTSKSASFDMYATACTRPPRRSAIDLTAGRRQSGVQAVSSLKSVDNILSNYSFFVTCHRGSHAKIIRGRSKYTGERVVLKVYDKLRLPMGQLENITKEIKLLTMAKGSEGVVQLLGSYEDSQQAIAVLEECTGGTLISHMVANGGRLSERYCIRLVVRPLLVVLAWFHNKGIILRDLKPEHIMFDSCGRLRLVDLFSAAVVGEDSLVNREGSLSYMAPEVLSKPAPDDAFHDIIHGGLSDADIAMYSEKVDIWSLGVMIFEALTGRQPFLAENFQEMASVQDEILDVGNGIRSSLDNIKMKEFMSDGAVDFLNKVLQKDAAARPSAVQLMSHPWVQMTALGPCRGVHSLESIRSSRSEDIVYAQCV